LKKVTKPFTNLFIQLDKKVLYRWSMGEDPNGELSLIKKFCDKGLKTTSWENVTTLVNVTTAENAVIARNVTSLKNVTRTVYSKPCRFLFHGTSLSDTVVGVIMLAVALTILCTCLILIVKLLHSLLKGKIAVVIRKSFNSDFPKPFGFLTGYVAILVGAGMTVLVQSSSIFTSAMTPLVGMGVVSVDRIYPLTLGSNIGTTFTSILAAMASSSDKLAYALQISFCHLFFNISGILLFYPVPYLRRVPIRLARGLGNTTAEYRWFAIAYLIVCFGLIPILVFALSLAGWRVFVGVTVPIAGVGLFVGFVNAMQRVLPGYLPKCLRSWEWVPMCCKSLRPYNKLFSYVCICKKAAALRRRSTIDGTEPPPTV